MNNFFTKWHQIYKRKNSNKSRDKTYNFKYIKKYLPKEPSGIVVDIGCGEGELEDFLQLQKQYSDLYLFDGNEQTIKNLKAKGYKKAIHLRMPAKLPFDNNTVSFVYCSHMIEHLTPSGLHEFLSEINRILKSGGVLVLLAPLLWSKFYGDLTHVRPYLPETIIKYLRGTFINNTMQQISNDYLLLDLTYRYNVTPNLDEGIGANNLLIDFILQSSKSFLSFMGIKNYQRNGYCLILQKS